MSFIKWKIRKVWRKLDNQKNMNTVLYGHTGSNNRGCEAIVRSTCQLLKNEGIRSSIASYSPQDDIRLGLNNLGKLIAYRGYTKKDMGARVINGVMKKVFHYEYPYENFIQRDVFQAAHNAGSAIVIGGDTYCYGRTACVPSYNLLRFSEKNKIKTILWSCSIGEENIDQEKIVYLKKYDMIFPRECVTYKNMLNVGIPKEKLFQMSDSAFILNSREIELPEGFENILAYNPSYTLGYKKNQEQIFEARVTLLKYLLQNTDMKIALIPHVYSANQGDALCCQKIAKRLGCPERVFVFDKDYSCEEIKFIISKCRFLVAERTHASIAGYSQLIPTFVIGYSVKSIGIARDIFGTDTGFVMSYKNVVSNDDFVLPIMDFISREEEVYQQLKRVIPEYKQKAVTAAGILSDFLE